MEGIRVAALSNMTHSVRSPASVPGGDFKSTLNQVRAGEGKPHGLSLHEELLVLRDKMLTGHRFSSQELLLYQVKAGEFNLRVELLSRAAESALSTARRFQNQ